MTGAPYVELSVQAGDDPAICSGHKAGTPLPLCDHQHRYIFSRYMRTPRETAIPLSIRNNDLCFAGKDRAARRKDKMEQLKREVFVNIQSERSPFLGLSHRGECGCF